VTITLNTLRFQPPCLPGAAVGFALINWLNRFDFSEFANLLVMPIAVAARGSFHRSRAPFNAAACPAFRSAYNFIDVLYLAMLAYLRVMSNAVSTTVSFGVAALDFARDPLLFSSAMLQRGVRDLSKGTKLIVMGWAIAAYQSLLAALGIAALHLAPIPLTMKSVMVGRSQRLKILGVVIVVVSVFVMNVQQFFFRALAAVYRAVRLNVRDLMRLQEVTAALRVLVGGVQVKRIAVSLPAAPVGSAPTVTKRRLVALRDFASVSKIHALCGAFNPRFTFTGMKPRFLMFHAGKRKHILTYCQLANVNFNPCWRAHHPTSA